MHRQYNIIAIVLIAVISTALLVAARIDSLPTLSVISNAESFDRGESIRSDDEHRAVAIGDTDVYLSKNSQITLIDLHEGSVTINVDVGRIVVDGPLSITVRDLKTNIITPTSYVHYSWLNTIEVAALDGSFAYTQSTLPPYEKTETSFDEEASVEADFYSWVRSEIK